MLPRSMTKYVTIIFAFLLMIFTSKESKGQFYLTYGNMVNESIKEKVHETGQGFKYIDDSVSFKLAHRRMPMKGVLRILRTDDPDKLIYIPINTWIYTGSYPTISGIGRIEFRDTVTYDSLGNILRSVSYLKKQQDFRLHSNTTSQYKDSFFIEYTEYLKDNKVTRSFYTRIWDYNVAKPYDNKTKVPTGTARLLETDESKANRPTTSTVN